MPRVSTPGSDWGWDKARNFNATVTYQVLPTQGPISSLCVSTS